MNADHIEALRSSLSTMMERIDRKEPILEQLRVNEEMSFISLSSKEIDQVAAYLKYLHALEDH